MIGWRQLLTATFLLLIVASGVLGGGPVSAALSMIVELIACFLGAIGLAGLTDGKCPKEANPAIVLLFLICTIPLLQLVPLPAKLAAMLPGREVPLAIFELIGSERQSHPISLDPEQTYLTALSLIIPAATFIATLQLKAAGRHLIFTSFVAFATVSAIFGMFQSSSGGMDLGIYPLTHRGYPIGFFANRNHEADLLLIAIPFATYIISVKQWSTQSRALALSSAVILFGISIIATQSRSGIGLLPVSLFGSYVILLGDIRRRAVWLGLIPFAALSAAAYTIVSLSPIGTSALHRFSSVGDDLRPQIWQTTRTAIYHFWPMGSGYGAFIPTYNMFENLDSVSDAWVNHAHNDYLELLLGGGIFSVILLISYMVIFLFALTRRLSAISRVQRYAGVTAIAILMIHSLTDYPLRTSLLSMIFAFSSAIIYRTKEGKIRQRPPSPNRDLTGDHILDPGNA